MTMPERTWIHMSIQAALGKAAATWNLEVQIPGQPPKGFTHLANGDAAWDSLFWLGFSSLADGNTGFYLDNIALVNSEAIQ